jgi:hypothetical protein
VARFRIQHFFSMRIKILLVNLVRRNILGNFLKYFFLLSFFYKYKKIFKIKMHLFIWIRIQVQQLKLMRILSDSDLKPFGTLRVIKLSTESNIKCDFAQHQLFYNVYIIHIFFCTHLFVGFLSTSNCFLLLSFFLSFPCHHKAVPGWSD